MAKLSARGRKELFRMSREKRFDDGKPYRSVYAFMDDGNILHKSTWQGGGSGWKVSKLLGGTTVSEFEKFLEKKEYIKEQVR